MKIVSKVHELKMIYKEFGINVAFWQLVTKIYKFGVNNNALAYWMNRRKHKAILRYLYKEYNEIIEEYSHRNINNATGTNSNIIWTIWWQGEEFAPEALKVCINSMYYHSKGHEIIVISKKNYKNYLNLPEYILDKVDCNKINFIHFADIIRMYLLNRYGGMWLDATIFLSDEIPQKYFEYDYFTTKLERTKIPCISECRWNGTVFGGQSGYIFFEFMIEFFYRYWKKQDRVIDYFLIDYMTEIAYESLEEFKNQLDALPINNLQIFNTTPYMNETYDSQVYRNLCENTCFHKIQRRQDYFKTNNEGKQTLYGYIFEMNNNQKK